MVPGLGLIVALAIACVGCRGHDPTPREPRMPTRPTVVARAEPSGLRLPTTIVPRAYDLRLELDPDRESFRGRVEIQISLAAPSDRVWVHALDLEIASAQFRIPGQPDLPLAAVETRDELRAFTFGRVVPAGDATLAFEYTGLVGREAEGVFRQRKAGRWFLFTQSQATFARKLLPCFDEPALKATWRTTVVAPAGQVVLGNTPVASTQDLPDRRRETRFAELGPMSSYLLAFAVGPFELVDGGTVGRANVPVRVAVAPGDQKRAEAVIAWVPKLVAALEAYLDLPLPLAKLDFVAVPSFFGAMENPGLVLFEDSVLLGDPRDPVYLRKLVRFLAHELAHQWFGNSVTPAWWSDLWISESFATFFDDKLASALGPLDDEPLRTQLSRAGALLADRAIEARPLRRAIASTQDIDDAFDSISYEKGAAVLAMIEAVAGESAFRELLRAYVRRHAGRAITADDVLASLGATARAFAGYLDRAGAPVVDFATDCTTGQPTLTITPRDRAIVPVCVRYATTASPARLCTLAEGRTRLPLAGAPGCTPWIATNADGRGYYHAHGLPPGQLATLTTTERLALGHDRAAAVARGELAAPLAVADMTALFALRDPYAVVAALAIARELALLSGERTGAALSAWLALRLGPYLVRARLFAPVSPIDRALRDSILDVLPGKHVPPGLATYARELVESALASAGAVHHGVAFRLAAPAGGKALFDRVVAVAIRAGGGRQHALLEALGGFDAAFAPRVADLLIGSDFEADDAWVALAAMFERVETRSAAWRALRDRLPQILGELAAADAQPVLEATATLCDATERAEVARVFAPQVSAIPEGAALLARSLAAIDRCVARRTALGDLGAALAP